MAGTRKNPELPLEQEFEPAASILAQGVGEDQENLSLTSRMFESLKYPAYRIYWAAMMGQMGAMNMQMVARSWYMYDLTGSAALLGVQALANGIPMFALSLFGGVLADRVPKKYVLVAGQTASAVLSLAIGLLISLNLIQWGHLIGAGVIQGLIMGLMMPARQALVPELVEEKHLTNALALNAAGMNVNRLLIPAVAGLLIALVGIGAAYYVMAGLYVVALLFVLALPKTGFMVLQGGGALSDIRDGLRYIKGNPVLPTLLLVTLITVLLSMPIQMLMPVFTADVITLNAEDQMWMTDLPFIGDILRPIPELLGKSSFRLGLLMTVTGFGALVGSLFIAAVGDHKRGLLLLLSMLLSGVALVFFSASPWYYLSLLIAPLVGVGQAGRMSLSNALVQVNTVDIYRGRVMSIYMMEFGLNSVAVFGVAVLAGVVGVEWAIGGAGALLLFVSIYCLTSLTSIRNLD